jgi:hypothetical protein
MRRHAFSRRSFSAVEAHGTRVAGAAPLVVECGSLAVIEENPQKPPKI